MKWSEMTSRERDSLVAERVMGWSQFTEKGTKSDSRWYGINKYTGKYGYICPINSFHPTRKIEDAWRVIEVMRDRGLWLSDLNIDKRPNGEFYYECNFYDARSAEWVLRQRIEAPTAPEAICLAALKAVGCDVE